MKNKFNNINIRCNLQVILLISREKKNKTTFRETGPMINNKKITVVIVIKTFKKSQKLTILKMHYIHDRTNPLQVTLFTFAFFIPVLFSRTTKISSERLSDPDGKWPWRQAILTNLNFGSFSSFLAKNLLYQCHKPSL